MKKLICLLLVAAFAFGLAACDEKPSEKDSTPAVVGKWQNKTKTPDGVVTTQTLDVLEDGTANYHVDNKNADGTTESYDIAYTWVLEGSDLNLHGEKYDATYKYLASDDILIRSGVEFKRIG